MINFFDIINALKTVKEIRKFKMFFLTTGNSSYFTLSYYSEPMATRGSGYKI